MRSSTRARLGLVAAAATALAVAITPSGATAGVGSDGSNPSSDGPRAAHGVDSSSAIVRLSADPLATSPRTRPAPGTKINFSSSTVKSERALLAAARNDFKSWLRANAPAARVVGEYDVALNAVSVRLNGTSLDTLRSAPGVVSASYEALYTPLRGGRSTPRVPSGTSITSTSQDPDLGLIAAVPANDRVGWGVQVAIIDTGIDVTHPCFSGDGFPSTKQLGDTNLTNKKVIVAKVFNNKATSRGYTAFAEQDHGTHVAGTVACDLGTHAVVSGTVIPYDVSGVAPGAQLGNYNVFPGDVLDARSEDILDALQAAYLDGMDVANLSLGGGANGNQDLLTVAIDNLDRAGMVVAVAAGNSGPGPFTVESPGSAARALTAGASTVGHFVGAPVTVGGTSYGAASGDFATVSADLTADLGVVADADGGLGQACSALESGSLAGKIALVARGTCTFSTKVKVAEDAGAAAVLVANNVAGDPVAMSADATVQPAPEIPAYMVAQETGAKLLSSSGATATIGATLSYLPTGNDNIMAGFSSQGPTDVDYRVKPDVVAPGVNVLSSIPLHFCRAGEGTCWAFFQGTSMATPHLAGMAAALLSKHKGWSAEQVRSAVVNTAVDDLLTDFQTGESVVKDVQITGAGLANLAAASDDQVAVGP
ncbi:MAG TPA: S8 family serine peptidase, partial [Actinomycetes bacterium]|nr:S8 family serine peptidase [Actinomycetes bacterium]